MDALRIYVVFDQRFEQGIEWVEFLTQAFGSLGMTRGGARTAVPVHARFAPWGASQPGLEDPNHPRIIELGAARQNWIVVLEEAIMADNSARWSAYFAQLHQQITARAGLDAMVTVQLGKSPFSTKQVQAFRDVQADLPKNPNAELARTRLIVRLLNAILVKRQPAAQDSHKPGHRIFVSHAKRDGAELAARIVEVISEVGRSLGPQLFFDAESLVEGQFYPDKFEEAISRGSLLALATDAYHTRPWCRWEMLTAKGLDRPVVAADLGAGRVERTYPYLGNVLSVRFPPTSPEAVTELAVARLVRAVLEEALRIDLWREQAQALLGGREGEVSVRPPELASLVTLKKSVAEDKCRLVMYPDPPLSSEEIDLLSAAFPHIKLCTPSQLRA